MHDIRCALRALRRNPGFSTVVVLTLALGIGANTAIFSLFEAVMLRTLPLERPDDLFFIAHGSGGPAAPGSNYPYFERFLARPDVFAGVTTYLRSTFKVTTGETTEPTQGQLVSGNYHRILGVPIALGRGFVSGDDRGEPDDALAAVISDGYWATKFGRDPAVLGRTLVIDGRHMTIVGVTAPGFSGLDPGTRCDITLPLAVRTFDQPGFLTEHGTWFGDMPIVARLKPGVTSARAAAVADAVFQQYWSEPDNSWLFKTPARGPVHASLLPAGSGTGGLRDQYSGSLQLLMAMVGVVLLIGCANVANLLLARGTARAREVAVRLSIGAGRGRLIRQFLTESIVLAVIGGALGLVIGRIGADAVAALVATGANPIQLDLQPNAIVLAFTLVVSIVTGVLFGLAPAFGCTRVEITPVLKSAGGAVGPAGRGWSSR